ncbi:hypothetical protein NSK11_contig00102-0037 [Nocardia seriolae]|nr:hypothetical protein NS14008_10535 [Nocardia seriolae]PSK28746.1 hypothetical protein C6575_24965 [Nocardia seriolae]RLP29412.1 hypothetical protein D6158_24225 [Nocardia seriolae]BAW08316.1 conserved hypothetical protein [Nocardia seriolae]GAM49121.1 hypothetical protein NS07_v2contig00096-0036 [Nocardia seriolae]
MLRTDLTALRIMAAGIRNEATAIAAIDPIDLIAQVARAMPNSATGSAALGVTEPLLAALRRMSTHLNTFADTADHGATTYEETQHNLETQLGTYLHGTS